MAGKPAAIMKERGIEAGLLCVNTGISTAYSLNTVSLTDGVWKMPLPDCAVVHTQLPLYSDMLPRFVT